MSTPEKRLDRLEEQVYFQEQTLTALNKEIVARRQDMHKLETRLASIEKRLLALLPLLEDGGLRILPQHYEQKNPDLIKKNS